MSLRLWTVPFISIWAALTATHYVTGRTADAEYEYIGLLTAGSFFWFGRYTALSERRRRRVNRVIAVLALIYGVAVFIQHFALPNTILGHQNLLHQGRLTGTFLSANTAATFLGLLFLFCLHRFLSRISDMNQSAGSTTATALLKAISSAPVTIAALIFLASGILLTGSRAGLFAIGLCASLLLATFLIFRTRKSDAQDVAPTRALNIVTPVCLALFCGVTLWAISGSLIDERMQTLESDFSDRQIMNQAAWQAGHLNPWIGHGLGSIRYAVSFVSTPQTNTALTDQNAAHNIFLQWFVQAGWPGMIGLIALILFTIFWTVSQRHDLRLKISIISAIIMVVIHGLFDFGLEIPSVLYLLAFFVGSASSKPLRNPS